MPNHTEGTWIVEGRTIYALEHHGWRKGVEQFHNRFSAHVQGYNTVPEEELVANARLMGAAKDLLEALETFVDGYVASVAMGDWGDWNPEEEPRVIKARQAIAKAKGQQS